MDVISRLRSLIIEFERKKRDVVVICNIVRAMSFSGILCGGAGGWRMMPCGLFLQSVLRCLLGYFAGVEAERVPFIEAPKHTVIELSPHRDGCDMKQIPLHVTE